jgi:hypothetical protein
MPQDLVLANLSKFLMIEALDQNAKEYIALLNRQQKTAEAKAFKKDFKKFLKAYQKKPLPPLDIKEATVEDRMKHQVTFLSQQYTQFLNKYKKRPNEEKIAVLQKALQLPTTKLPSEGLPNPAEDLFYKLVELDSGYCFGLSLVDGVMDEVLGPADFTRWKHELFEMASWNGQDLFGKKVMLPTREGGMEEVPLRNVFLKGLERIIPHQPGLNAKNPGKMRGFDPYYDKQVLQSNILKPSDEKYLQVSVRIKGKVPEEKEEEAKYEVKTVQTYVCFSGYFTIKNLKQILNPVNFGGNICVLLVKKHALRIGYKDPKWILYNPNDDHHISPDKTHSEPLTQDELIEKMMKYGNEFAFRICAFSKKEFDRKAYEAILRDSPASLLQADGFAFMTLNNLEELGGAS